MTVTLNGKKHDFEKQITLLQLLQKLNIPPNGKAIALNQQVIPKVKWNEVKINENDEILIITATQGG